jgi:predicted amino acid-binding ACT domain protein
MKFFVSSRMREVYLERKTAIEVIHSAGHTPLYLETEKFVKDREARDTMLSLLADAEGFVSIHYLSQGRPNDEWLDHLAPIQFELVEFTRLHPKAPVLLFRQKVDSFVAPSLQLIDWFNHRAIVLRTPIHEFEGSQELHASLMDQLSHYKGEQDAQRHLSRVIIRYMGPDFIGLVALLSQILFSKYKWNVDYISQGSRDVFANLFLSCSPRSRTPEITDTTLELLRVELSEAITQSLQPPKSNKNRKQKTAPVRHFSLEVNRASTEPHPPQFFMEIRTIDAPGQLNTVCKILRDMKFNIDDLQLRPTPSREYPRQTISFWWISRPDSRPRDRERDFVELEAKLQYLVGVRAFTIRIAGDE